MRRRSAKQSRAPSPRALPLFVGLSIVAACGPAADWPEVQWGPSSPTFVDAHPTEETEVLVTQDDGRVVLFGLVDSTWRRRRTIHANVAKARWSLDGAAIIGACRDGRLRAWNRDAEALWATDPDSAHDGPVLDLDLHGERIATIGYDGTVRQWLLDGRPTAAPFQVAGAMAFGALAYSRDGRRLATGDQDGHVAVWTPDGEKVRVAIHEGARRDLITRVGFLPDGRVAASSYTGRVGLESGFPERPVLLLERGQGGTLRVRKDGSILATDEERRLWRWDFAAKSGEGGVIAEDLEVVALTAGGALWRLELDDQRFFNQPIRLRIVRPFSPPGESRGHEVPPPLELSPRNAVRRLVLLPGDAWLAAPESASTMTRGTWNGGPAEPALEAGGSIYDLAASPDGRWIAGGGDSPAGFRLWHRDREEPVFSYGSAGGAVLLTVKFTADGRYLAAHNDTWIRVFRLTGAKLEDLDRSGSPEPLEPIGEPFQSEGEFGQSFDFSPDGETIAALTWDGRVQLFERTGKPRAEPFDEHGGGLVRIAFSPRGDLIAAARETESVVLYEPDGAVVDHLERPGSLRWLAFDAAGERLAIATDGLIEIRRVEPSGSRVEGLIPAPRSEQIGFHRDLLWSLGDQGHVLVWNRRGELVRQMHVWDSSVLVLEAGGEIAGFGSLLDQVEDLSR